MIPAIRNLHEERNRYAVDLHKMTEENHYLKIIRAIDCLPLSVHELKSIKGRFYILTAAKFNHIDRPMKLDKRFFDNTNTSFYFFDKEINLYGFPRPAQTEFNVYPDIAEAGRYHFAEWSFLLAEYEKSFANYPFFMTSSRFYEKNLRLKGSLGDYQTVLFDLLDKYGYGYLPSYDRNLSFIDLEEYRRQGYLGGTEQGLHFIQNLFGVDMTNEGRWISDYFCNYIGFKTRDNLKAYVEYYLPLFKLFFDDQWNLIYDYKNLEIVRPDMTFREFKPLSLLLEQISHLFFLKNKIPFLGMHYDGFYEVNEWRQEIIKIN